MTREDHELIRAAAAPGPAPWAIGQLRHLYAQMVNGHVRDVKSAAIGLLGPAIEALEASASPEQGEAREAIGKIVGFDGSYEPGSVAVDVLIPTPAFPVAISAPVKVTWLAAPPPLRSPGPDGSPSA